MSFTNNPCTMRKRIIYIYIYIPIPLVKTCNLNLHLWHAFIPYVDARPGGFGTHVRMGVTVINLTISVWKIVMKFSRSNYPIVVIAESGIRCHSHTSLSPFFLLKSLGHNHCGQWNNVHFNWAYLPIFQYWKSWCVLKLIVTTPNSIGL